jgi:outer membrane receptor protein involved in Fe transport
VKGNEKLKPAYINNFDFRYEIYPSDNELISLALFYKHFKSPIEWTYLDAGGSYTYTFENAELANNLGLELEIRKSLNFISLPNLFLTFNGAIIDSKVSFGAESRESDRPMQGQSPYIVNAGLFYLAEKIGLQAGALYNIIGKRIVGIGRADGSQDHSISNTIPDTYEMPRHAIDLTISKKFGKAIELKAAVRDLLAQPVTFVQTPQYYDNTDGALVKREQTTKKYMPGRTFSIGLTFSL